MRETTISSATRYLRNPPNHDEHPAGDYCFPHGSTVMTPLVKVG